jgi:hypothetical protein
VAEARSDLPAERPAFYALARGGWRDYVTLLHPPYTAWHLSYVALGWAAAPAAHLDRLAGALAAFFLAVGIAAHALDELRGRPLGTRIPGSVLVALAAGSLAGAVGLGVWGAARSSWWALGFVVFGAFIVCAYNLEWAGGRFHTDVWFALAWGAFPALTASWANALRFTPEGLLVAAGCYALSRAQRALSTPVRELRRRTRRVLGVLERTDGTVRALDASALRAPGEAALRWTSLALPVLAAAAVLARTR